jgi:hypothetical protein
MLHDRVQWLTLWHGNEVSGSIKWRQFLYQLSDYQLSSNTLHNEGEVAYWFMQSLFN